jgi:acyl-CoA dehydrogenase
VAPAAAAAPRRPHRPIFALYKKMLPAMSQTEREALEAGTVWWEGELFSGKPAWGKLLAYPQPKLTPAEQSFLDNECEALCAMSHDWDTTQIHHDLPPEAWAYIKDKGFLGMIIPKRYGGLEFSAYAHSAVVQKLSTRCSAAAVSVMVPNSLGPAELLLHYGTEEQKDHYLPRLAKGQEIPAFALTSPQAGSDAASIPDLGIVCKGQWQGKEVIGMRVTWDKRYITLGPICTVLGLAFRLQDPEHLLGDKEDLGITCALVPTGHPGVNIGRRHFPLNAAWQNGPNSGKDVFMPLDWIIGGPAMAGQGWRMLMECLAAGRSISLPSSNTGMAKLAVRATGAYARVRSQFKTAIGRFEGIEEPLARMGGKLYAMDAARTMTAGAIDLGEKPSVVSAIVKYHVTEGARQVVNDAMDILGGKGICLGPNNFMGRAYQQIPVAITVEGANILTRSLIIFGQGAIRCHPYVLKEMAAAKEAGREKGPARFRCRVRRAPVVHLDARLPLLEHGPHRLQLRIGAGRCGARDAPLLPAALALLGRFRFPRRRLDVRHGRRPEAQGEALGAPGRHPLADVPGLGHAQALRSRRPPGGRCAAAALGDLGRHVPHAERLRGRDLQLPEPLHRRAAALVHLPARPPLRSALRQAWPRSRAVADRAFRHARPPYRRHVRAEG